MGASQSAKTKKDIQILNGVTMDFVAKVSTSINAPTIQKMSLSIVADGPDSSVSGISLDQKAKVSISAVSKIAQSADLKQELVTKLRDSMKTNQMDAAISNTTSDQDLKQVIDNSVQQTFTSESVMEMNASIEQDMAITLIAKNGGQVDDMILSQEAEMIADLSQDVTAGIVNQLSSKTDTASESSSAVDSQAAGVIDSAGGVVGNVTSMVSDVAGSLGLGIISTMMIPILIIIAIIIFVIIMKNMSSSGGGNGGIMSNVYGGMSNALMSMTPSFSLMSHPM